jgi:endonuclease YncB( thermonuclease family)
MISHYYTAAILFLATVASHAQNWQRIDNCKWLANRWNDGDSFHLLTGDASRELVARLYFVDTPESETAYRDRLDEQSAYFGITRKQGAEIAHEASEFTKQRLAQPFTVWTRSHKALGRSAVGRVYCVIFDSTGRDLNELLVENGLARIYGTKTILPDGRDSKAYVGALKMLEARAKSQRKGAWKFNS